MPGRLSIVATPIGNLEDISLRALKTLRSADKIAAEDTRHTRKLLTHFNIKKPLIAFHEYSSPECAQRIVEEIAAGAHIAFVSDAGTPGISDPGQVLVAQARRQNVPVEGIPGACAAVCAYSISGIAHKRFYFFGFLEDKAQARAAQLQSFLTLEVPVILYVAPHKLQRTLQDIQTELGASTRVTLLRELTKIHEEYLCGTPQELLCHFEQQEIRGEFVLILEIQQQEHIVEEEEICRALRQCLQSGMRAKEAAKTVSERLKIPKNQAYALAIREREDEK